MNPSQPRRNVFQCIVGTPATGPPIDDGCWIYSQGRILIDLTRAPELSAPGGALRLEGGELPFRILVVNGADHRYHAYKNYCAHRGRRLDPLDGGCGVCCCSLGRSTYDLRGRLRSGPATRPLTICPAHRVDGRLIVTLLNRARVRSGARSLNGEPLRLFV